MFSYLETKRCSRRVHYCDQKLFTGNKRTLNEASILRRLITIQKGSLITGNQNITPSVVIPLLNSIWLNFYVKLLHPSNRSTIVTLKPLTRSPLSCMVC